MKKVYIVQPWHSGFIHLFRWMGFEMATIPSEADVICFTGGSDVSPNLYGHRMHPTTYSSPDRDLREKKLYDDHVGKVLFCGVCRGGQFLNVMNGGELYQDVSGHGKAVGHLATDVETDQTFLVSSTHHQMIKPALEGQIILTAQENGERTWWDKKSEMFKTEKSKVDVEAVYYPKSKSFCFQPHPEYDDEDYVPMREYFKSKVLEYLDV